MATLKSKILKHPKLIKSHNAKETNNEKDFDFRIVDGEQSFGVKKNGILGFIPIDKNIVWINILENQAEVGVKSLPNDYKPTKEDKVLKVKVGNVKGEIVGVKGKGIFIRANSQANFSYVDKLRNPSELFLVNYPQYSVMVQIDNSGDRNDGGGSVVDFYQIFAVGDELKAFLLGDGFSPIFPLFCSIKRNDSPCPYAKDDVLDWIKKQGGQEFFDYACPAYYDDLNGICDQGIIRAR